MKKAQLIGASLCLAVAAISTGANAGCLGGAAAGSVAGHFLHHHGVAGAAAGCAIGHYRSKHKAARADQASSSQVSQTQVRPHHHWFHRA